MMGKVSALVVRSLRLATSEVGSISQKGFDRDHLIVDSFRHYSQSSTSGWGTGESLEEETQERGASPGPLSSTGTAAAEKPAGRHSEPTSSSALDTGGEVGGAEQTQPPATKKSRTGGDMSDEGQVHTPNLQKMRSTHDIFNNAGKETEERLASEKKSPT